MFNFDPAFFRRVRPITDRRQAQVVCSPVTTSGLQSVWWKLPVGRSHGWSFGGWWKWVWPHRQVTNYQLVLGVWYQLRPVNDGLCLFIAAGVTATDMMTPALRILPSETLLVRWSKETFTETQPVSWRGVKSASWAKIFHLSPSNVPPCCFRLGPAYPCRPGRR